MTDQVTDQVTATSNLVPDAVKRQSEYGTSIQEAMSKGREALEADLKTDIEKSALDKEKTDKSKAQDAQGTPQKTDKSPSDPEKPTDKPKPEHPKDKGSDSFEQKYSVLKGKYDAEIPRLQTQVNDLTTRMNTVLTENHQLRQEVDTLKAGGGDGKSDAAKTADGKPAKINPEDFEAYGDSFVQMANMLNEVVSGASELSSKIKRDEETRSKTEYDRFKERLIEKVPDLDALNYDPNYLTWLNEIPAYSTITRLEYLRQKEAELDVDAVAATFLDFKKLKNPSKTDKDDPKPNPNKKGLEDFVVPDTAGGDGVQVDVSSGKIYKRAEIAQFFQDKIRGKLKGTPEEIKAKEADIHRASAEGRIQG